MKCSFRLKWVKYLHPDDGFNFSVHFLKKLTKKIGPDDGMRMKTKESNLKNKKLGIEMLTDDSSSIGSESEADNERENRTAKKNFKNEAGGKNGGESEDDLLVKKTDRQIHETMDDKPKVSCVKISTDTVSESNEHSKGKGN